MLKKNLFIVLGAMLTLSACATSTHQTEKALANGPVEREPWDCASLLDDPSRKLNECSHKDVVEHLLNKSMKPGERAVLLNPDEIVLSPQHSIDMRLANNAHIKNCERRDAGVYQAEFFTYVRLTTPVKVTLPARVFVRYKIEPKT